MSFLCKTIIYQTKLLPETVTKRLEEVTEPARLFPFWLFSSRHLKPYVGKVWLNGFRLKNIQTGKEPFWWAHGQLEQNEKGTLVIVKLQITPYTFISVCGMCIAFGSLIYVGVNSGDKVLLSVGVVFTLLTTLLTVLFYNSGYADEKNNLKAILKGTVVKKR